MPHKDPADRREYQRQRYYEKKRLGQQLRGPRDPFRGVRLRGRPPADPAERRSHSFTFLTDERTATNLRATLAWLNEGGRYRTYRTLRGGMDVNKGRLTLSAVLNYAVQDWMKRTLDLPVWGGEKPPTYLDT